MPAVRTMTPDDIEEVINLDVLAFTDYWRQTGHKGGFPARTPQNILAALALNPGGCFVAADGRIAGYVFSRRWGETGWIGTFGVHPEERGQGLGRLLLEAAVRHLRGAGCTVIGLETMPDSPYNVGLYLRSGFRLIHPTVHMTRDLGPISADGEEYSLFSAVEKAPALAAAAALSRAVSPGLDYTVEVQNAHEFGWGETLLFGRPDPWALAVVRTLSRRGDAPEPQAEVNPLIVHPEKASRLENVLAAVEDFAFRHGFRQSALSVNAADAEALRAVLDRGYRVANVRVRMILGRDWEKPAGIDLSRWIM